MGVHEEVNMKGSVSEPLPVHYSLRVYRLLLYIFPSEFRREYEHPMLQVFRDCCRRKLTERGSFGLATLWARTMLDTLAIAIEEHSQREVDMSKEKFIRLAGWALPVGGLAVILGWLAGMRPEYYQYNLRSLWIDQYLNVADMYLVALGMLLLSVGFIGLLVRYGAESGQWGRLWLGFGAMSGLVSAIGAAGLGMFDSNPWWSMFFFGMAFNFLAMALFGVLCLRGRLLPKWNGLPLLAGIWIPLFLMISMLYEVISGGWLELPDPVFGLIWTLSLIGIAGVGYLLQADSPAQSTLKPV
jgi:hypothetical protein